MDTELEAIRVELEALPKDGEPVIPRGWTYLKHGTGTERWGNVNPYTSDIIEVRKYLSTVSRRDHEYRQANHGKSYDTTRTYSTGAGKPFEMRIIFYENHNQLAVDPEFRDRLSDEQRDLIARYHYRNEQRGRHPVVPRGEVLLKVADTVEDGRDVFYFVPERVAEDYVRAVRAEFESE